MKQTVVVPVLEDNVSRLQNSTFVFRLFFLIGGLNPPEVYTFNGGLLLLDQVCILVIYKFQYSN